MTERIIAAAVRYQGATFSLLPPARHGECLWLLRAARPDSHDEEQGFVTDRNRFVGRQEARKIAEAAGQLIERAGNLPELYSEDVW